MSLYGTNFIGLQATDLGNIMLNKTSSTLDFPSNTTTLNKKQIVYSNPIVIKETDIVPQMNGICMNGDQVFTFGPKLQEEFIGTGSGTTNSILISTDGMNWYGLGVSVSNYFNEVRYNGSIWVATAYNTHALAYSYNGVNWVGLGTSIFTNGWSVAWNGTLWVAGGAGTNSLAYSYDGINWVGLGQSFFTGANGVRGVHWNGSMWLACGQASSSGLIAYSYDGLTWSITGSNSSTIFNGSNQQALIARWNGTIWLAGALHTSATLAYSSDGITWTAVTSATSIISTYAPGISWNGKMWHAGGTTNPMFSYTYDVTAQTGWTTINTTSILSSNVIFIQWNGRMFVATGGGTNNYAYSYNGVNWIGTGGILLSVGGVAVESPSFRPHTITFSRNLTIAVGNGSSHTIAYSLDGINFTGLGRTTFTTEGNVVKYNGRYWVAGGQGGNSLAFSRDGYSWAGLNTSIFTQTNGLAYSNTMWVGVGSGNGNSIAYSNDGLTWIGLGSSVFTTGNHVAWNGTIWVAVGSGNGNTVAYSTNGVQWTGLGTIFTTQGNGIAWNGSIWVAVGNGSTTTNTAYSYNGLSWSYATNTISTVNNVTYANNKWVSLGGSNASYSYDGINWTTTASSPFTINGNAIAYNGTVWTAAGAGSGSISQSYSYDAINWIPITSPLSNYGTDVATNYQVQPKPYIQHPSIAMSTGTNKIHYSPDGIVWQPLSTSVFGTQGNRCFWNGTIWVASGSGGNSLAYSFDGVSWIGLGLNIFMSGSRSICYNGSIWVAVGSGMNTIAYSYDGLSWFAVGNSTSIFSSYGQDVAWNGIAFVATGAGGNTIATSTNGITWEGSVTGSTFSTNGAGIWSNGPLWVVTGVGTNSIVYTWDRTGRTGWTAVASSPFSTSGSDVAWNGSLWVAVGTGTTNTVATSTNGITWTGRGLIVPTAGGGICWNGVRWILTSNTSSATPIYYSQNGINWFSTAYSITGSIHVSSNPGVGAFAPPSALVLDNYGINGNGYTASQTLDLVSSNPYYQNGWDNVSITVNPTYTPELLRVPTGLIYTLPNYTILNQTSNLSVTPTVSGNTTTLAFTIGSNNTSGSCNIMFGSATNVQVLVVGGGGGGGKDMGPGGGAGGVIYSSSFNTDIATPYNITVGPGGTGSTNNTVAGGNGGNSVFSTLTAIGGGGAAGQSVTGTPASSIGGSGGGGTRYNATGASGTNNQGNKGGNLAIQAPPFTGTPDINTTISGYYIVGFTTGSKQITITRSSTIYYLVVAGGGAGGYDTGGGGGAGGVLQGNLSLSGNDTIMVNVGAGGLALSTYGIGGSGGNSSIIFTTNTANNKTAIGGGGGGGATSTGGTGGSGGGGGWNSTGGIGTAGPPRQGYNGATNGDRGGGGGGAGANASAFTGGIGVLASELGIRTYYSTQYWGGGGGGGWNSGGGTGGLGGGGGGGANGSGGGTALNSGTAGGANTGGNGGANTGGGGGGGRQYNQGGNGGSGIVVLAIPITTNLYSSGGGGGAGIAGENGSSIEGGAGGDGIFYPITGTSIYYAGGGGGSSQIISGDTYSTTLIETGGIGGGGSSSAWTTAGDISANSGIPNTGGGGGGGADISSNIISNGGNGGSGIVLVSFTQYSLVTSGLINHYNFTDTTSYYPLTGSGTAVTTVRNLVNGSADMTLYNNPFYLSSLRTMTFINTNATGTNNIQCMQSNANVTFRSVSIWYRQLQQLTTTNGAYLFDGRPSAGTENQSFIYNTTAGTIGAIGTLWTNCYYDGGSNITPSWRGNEYTNNTWHNVTFTAATAATGLLTIAGRFNRSECANLEIAAVLVYDRKISQAENTQNYNYYFNVFNNNGIYLNYLSTPAIYYAFSLRLLIPTYTGPIIRIRRSNDDAVSDFYADATQSWFTTGANNSGTTYATWIGANTGYVVTWYDQSGKGNHATQSDTTLQPQIFLQSTKYVLYFTNTGSGTYLSMTNTNLQANTIFCQFNPISAGYNTIFSAGIGTDFGQRFLNNSVNGNSTRNDWYPTSRGTKYNYINDVSNTTITLNTWNTVALSVQSSSKYNGNSLSVIGTDGNSRDRGLNGYMTELMGHNIQMPIHELSSFFTNRFNFLYNISSQSANLSVTPSSYGSNTVLSFVIGSSTSNGTCSVMFGSTMTVQVLVVAGGGGGGRGLAPGGGAGGVIYRSFFPVTAGTTYSITVGAGGIGSNTNTVIGGNGNNSVFSTLTATGGGGAAGQSVTGASGTGGSGGGGTRNANSGTGSSGTNNQGNKGGNFVTDNSQYYCTGGGGGAETVGQNGITSLYYRRGGQGGNGIMSLISGNITYYGGGGGGACQLYPTLTTPSAIGGIGGGGDSSGTTTDALSGTANTGGGGGGGDQKSAVGGTPTSNGGNGGSGIVIISFPSTPTTQPALVTSGLVNHYNFTDTSCYYPLTGAGAAVTSITNLVNSTADMSLVNSPTYLPFSKTLFLDSSVGNQHLLRSSSTTFQSISIWYRQYAQPAGPRYLFDGQGGPPYAANSWVYRGGSTNDVGPMWTNCYFDGGSNITPVGIVGRYTDLTWHNVTYTSTTQATSGAFRIGANSTGIESMTIEIAVILIYNRQITQAENTQNYNYYNNLLNNNGLFLTYTNPMAMYYGFSVRLLVSTYAGPILRIRRSNDNVESDFYANFAQTWLTTGANNTGTSYATWIGANTGYVVTWYDQSGKGNHATQSTTTIQPSISLQNGKYVLSFVRTGSGNYLSITNDTLRANTLFCHFYPTSGSTINCNTIFTAGIGNDFSQRFNGGNSNTGNDGDWYVASSGLKYSYVNGTSTATVSLDRWTAMASSVQMTGVSPAGSNNKSLSIIGTDGYERSRGLGGYMTELIGHNIQMPTSELIAFNTNTVYNKFHSSNFPSGLISSVNPELFVSGSSTMLDNFNNTTSWNLYNTTYNSTRKTLVLNGTSSYLMFNNRGPMNNWNGTTLSIVFYYYRTVSDSNNYVLSSIRRNGTDGMGQSYLSETRYFDFRNDSSGFGVELNYGGVSGSAGWKMISVVKNGLTSTVYLNGSQIATQISSASVTIENRDIALGADWRTIEGNFGGIHYLPGEIFFAGYWNQALTGENISSIYNYLTSVRPA